MKLESIKNVLTGTLASLLFFSISNSAHAIEATYLCPSPLLLQIANVPSQDDHAPMKYSSVMTGKITGFDPRNASTDIMWDNVPLAGQGSSDTYLPKTSQEQMGIQIMGAVLATDKVFCEYQLPNKRNIKLATTRNLLVPPTNCDKIRTAEGLVGFQCKK
jgi:hypothetical protein